MDAILNPEFNHPIATFVLAFFVGLLFIISLKKVTDKKPIAATLYALSGLIISGSLALPSPLNFSHVYLMLGLIFIGVIAGVSIAQHRAMVQLPEFFTMSYCSLGFVILGLCSIEYLKQSSSALDNTPLFITVLFAIYIIISSFILFLKMHDTFTQILISTRIKVIMLITLVIVCFIYALSPQDIKLTLLYVSCFWAIIFSCVICISMSAADTPILIAVSGCAIGCAMFSLGLSMNQLILTGLGGVVFGSTACLVRHSCKAMNKSLIRVLFNSTN